jgi:saccharopepsin
MSTTQPLYPVSSVFLTYQGNVKLGNNNVSYPIIYDTGSCGFWVDGFGANNSTSIRISNTTASRIVYQDGTVVEGKIVTDSVSLGNITVSKLDFESATNVQPNRGLVNGVLGLCRANFADGKSFLYVATLKQKLFTFSISADTRTASISLGSLDVSNFVGPVAWIPVNPSSATWDTTVVGLSSSDGAVNWAGSLNARFDTGSSMLSLPAELASKVNAMYSFTKLQGASVYTGSCPSHFPDYLRLSFAGVSLDIKTASLVYGNGVTCYSAITDSIGNDMVVGNSVLRNYYTIFNGGNNTVGFATAKFSSSDSQSSPSPTPIGSPDDSSRKVKIIVGALMGCLLLVILLVALWAYLRRLRKRKNADIDTETAPEMKRVGFAPFDYDVDEQDHLPYEEEEDENGQDHGIPKDQFWDFNEGPLRRLSVKDVQNENLSSRDPFGTDEDELEEEEELEDKDSFPTEE